MWAFVRRWIGGTPRLAPRTRLHLQSLEDRCTPATDLLAQSLSWNSQGGATVDFAALGDNLRVDTTAALYWATGSRLADRIGLPVRQVVIYHGAASDPAPLNIARASLGIRPARATQLMLVVDPLNRVAESDEADNTQTVAVPDIVVDSVTTVDSRSVTVTYEVKGLALDEVPLRLVRSADNHFDAGDLSLAPVDELDGSLGTHTVTLDLAQPLGINPSRPFVLAQVDAANTIFESNELNNAGWFRKRELGVVTHGLELLGQFQFARPTWPAEVANLLRAQGYDRAIAFDWAAISNLPVPGMTTVAAEQMAARIETELAAMKKLWPSDVIDVHLIGHSRGGPVISQVALLLQDNPDVIQGTLRLTFLDPHPASNVPGRHDWDAAFLIGFPIERIYIGFKALAQDPDPVVAPEVDIADDFYQHTDTTMARAGSGERILNLWGNIPIVNDSPYSIHAVDLTGPGMSHGEVINWFIRSVVPLLGRGLA
jgi:hypothetical protein